MFWHPEIQIELIKLVNGDRLLRLTEPKAALTLERKIDPKQPVLRQKQNLMTVFEAALERSASLAS